MSTKYAPPPGPPPGFPPLRPSPSLSFSLALFSQLGYVTLPLQTIHPTLYAAYVDLFSLSHQFFSLPLTEKEQFHIPAHMQTSEEGFSVVEGEKEMITLRRAKAVNKEGTEEKKRCPEMMIDTVKTVWTLTGEYLRDIARGIAISLNLPEDKFDAMITPCISSFPSAERTATLLRMFQYTRPPPSTPPKVVSEGHRDLGLLTLVVGHSPGLEAWDPRVNEWISLESESDSPDQQQQPHQLTATLLSGQTLSRLSNSIFTAGRHRVLVHPPRSPSEPYRFSLVFALRAHLPITVSSSEFTTEVTGEFMYPFERVTMGDMYKAIADVHFNVNIGHELREEQRRRMANGVSTGNAMGAVTNIQSQVDEKEIKNRKKNWRRSLIGIFTSKRTTSV